MKIPRLRSHQEIGGESGKDCVLLCGREAQPNSGLNGGLFFSDNEKAEGSFQLTALPCDLHPPAYHLVVTRWLHHLWHCGHGLGGKKQRVKDRHRLPFRQLS